MTMMMMNNPVVIITFIVVCCIIIGVIGYYTYNAIRKGGPTFGDRYQVAPNLDLDFTGVADTDILADALLGYGDFISLELEKVVDANNAVTDTQLCEGSKIHISHGMGLGQDIVVSEVAKEYALCDFGNNQKLVLSAKLLSAEPMATMVVKSEFKGFTAGSKLTLEQINKIPKGINLRWTTKNGLGTKLTIGGKTVNDAVATSAAFVMEFKKTSADTPVPDYSGTTTFKMMKA